MATTINTMSPNIMGTDGAQRPISMPGLQGMHRLRIPIVPSSPNH